jgi:hypothetical protein
MPRMSRLFLAAALSTLAALLPVTAFAGDLTASIVGAEYAFGHLCIGGTKTGTTVGTTASFAGVGSVPAGGRANAVFNTTICHTDTDILAGGSFQLATRQRTLVGKYNYSSGALVPYLPTFYPGSSLCTQVFGVSATFVPVGSGAHAEGLLTHYGVREGSGCHAYAATIKGTATLPLPD